MHFVLCQISEAGRIRFRGVRFQTPNSVRFLGLTEFRGASSVSSSRPIICVPKRTHRVFRRTHWVCRRSEAQWVLFPETVLLKQYSSRFLRFLALGLAGAARPPHPSLSCFLTPPSSASALNELKWRQEGSGGAEESKNKVHVRKVHVCHPLSKPLLALFS